MRSRLVSAAVIAKADGNVRIGPRLITWGALASAGWAMPEATMGRMRQLAEVTGETVSVYIRRGLKRTVIGQSPSPHTPRHAVQVGDELPLWGGAAALVLLGMEAEPSRSRLIQDVADQSGGRIRAVDLAAQADQARADGFAASHGGRAEGTSGLAIPLHGGTTRIRIPAGLALGGPSFRFDEDAITRFLDELRTAANDIARTGLPPALY